MNAETVALIKRLDRSLGLALVAHPALAPGFVGVDLAELQDMEKRLDGKFEAAARKLCLAIKARDFQPGTDNAELADLAEAVRKMLPA